MASELTNTPSVVEFMDSIKCDVEACRRSNSSSSRSSADSIIDIRLGLKSRSPNNMPNKLFKIELISTKESHPFEMRSITVHPNTCVKVGRIIGKNKESLTNACFDTKVLSRHHAVIWYSSDNNKFWIKDTKSSNGTYLNNIKLETEPAELRFGDIVKFGLDVVENNTKEKHGCIIAYVKLYLPDDQEALPVEPNTRLASHSGETVISYRDLHRLNIFLQESIQREEMLQNKLNNLQSVVEATRQNTAQCWRSIVSEDQLLHIIHSLENKLMLAKQNMPENALKGEIFKLLDEKSSYQHAAKEALRRVYNERLDVKQTLSKLQVTHKSTEEESKLLTEQILNIRRNHEEVNSRLFTLESEYTKSKKEKAEILQQFKDKELACVAQYMQKMEYIKKKCEIIRSQVSILGDSNEGNDVQNQLVETINAIISDLNIAKVITKTKEETVGASDKAEEQINDAIVEFPKIITEEYEQSEIEIKDLSYKPIPKKSASNSFYIINLLKNVQENLKTLEMKIGNETNEIVVPIHSTCDDAEIDQENDELCNKKLRNKDDYLLLKNTISMLEAAYNEVCKDGSPRKDLQDQIKATSSINIGCGDYDEKTDIQTNCDDDVLIFYKNLTNTSTDSEDDSDVISVKRFLPDPFTQNKDSLFTVKTPTSNELDDDGDDDDDDDGNYALTAKKTVAAIGKTYDDDYASLIENTLFNSFNGTDIGSLTLSRKNLHLFDIENTLLSAKRSYTLDSDDDDKAYTSLSANNNDVELKTLTAEKKVHFLASDDVNDNCSRLPVHLRSILCSEGNDKINTSPSAPSINKVDSNEANKSLEHKSSSQKTVSKNIPIDNDKNDPFLTFLECNNNNDREDILLTANKTLNLFNFGDIVKDDTTPTTNKSISYIETFKFSAVIDEQQNDLNVFACPDNADTLTPTKKSSSSIKTIISKSFAYQIDDDNVTTTKKSVSGLIDEVQHELNEEQNDLKVFAYPDNDVTLSPTRKSNSSIKTIISSGLMDKEHHDLKALAYQNDDDNLPTAKKSISSIKTLKPSGLTDEEQHELNVFAYQNIIYELNNKIFYLEKGTQQSLQLMQMECDLLNEKIETLSKVNEKLTNDRDLLKKTLKKNKTLLSKAKKRKEHKNVPTENRGMNTDGMKNEINDEIDRKIGGEIKDEIKDEIDDKIENEINDEINREIKLQRAGLMISAISSESDLIYNSIQLKRNVMREADIEINNAIAKKVDLNVYDDYLNDITRDNEELCLELETLQKNALYSRATLLQITTVSFVLIIIISYIIYVKLFSHEF
ncbi:uncharacterized protein LOC119674190 [Teleopsis dalmanni]|uniref:uncharacterized protein LOC119674190 n=1 Tax=Teleopsis dalmanni TaxID=139649 RepID=UPI0018CF2E04|nr:uncharacterized protein LOC119674190 [Teleopsis dalmanni]XP_037941243.1 uncharacterized protein LOC119674190 [Teleopsis dalmanni]XP_037941244.1 uncharacterized protein LOC119674190 [Teleopsis dalmanni]